MSFYVCLFGWPTVQSQHEVGNKKQVVLFTYLKPDRYINTSIQYIYKYIYIYIYIYIYNAYI